MKSHVADYRYRVQCLRITATNGKVVRVTDHVTSLTLADGVYLAGTGFQFTGRSSGTSMAAGGLDLEGILSDATISEGEIASGVFDNATAHLFATTFHAPLVDDEPLSKLTWGVPKFDQGRFTVQLMELIDAVNQKVGRTYAPTCPWTLFDQTIDGRVLPVSKSMCTGPRAAPDGPAIGSYLVTGALTSVTSQYVFTDTSRIEADDWFAYGEIRFLTGPNAGLRPSQIKRFTPGGVIELHEALFYAPTAGDTYEMIPGCRKRASDCKDKFANKLNFGGQDHVPVPSVYSQVGRGA